jgi:predicted alpha/beta-hydrolase family hydrolase
MTAYQESVTIRVSATQAVSGLWLRPPGAWGCLLLAPGAGAGMHQPFLASLAEQLGLEGLATLRYQFPYAERGRARPDPPELCHATVRAAVRTARATCPDLPCIAGGKSFGGRMTSQAQAAAALEGVRGLVFLGFPLHPPAEPAVTRGQHLLEVGLPMLFLQGTRDAFADLTLLRSLLARLNGRATLKVFEDADHSFNLRAKARNTGAQLQPAIARATADWMRRVLGS